jgi:hypothetical protein
MLRGKIRALEKKHRQTNWKRYCYSLSIDVELETYLAALAIRGSLKNYLVGYALNRRLTEGSQLFLRCLREQNSLLQRKITPILKWGRLPPTCHVL